MHTHRLYPITEADMRHTDVIYTIDLIGGDSPLCRQQCGWTECCQWLADMARLWAFAQSF